MMPVYLDYNSTTPCDNEVKNAIFSALTTWGNPSSSHVLGAKAKDLVLMSRVKTAELINCQSPDEIVFTSGGTEANHLAIHSAVQCFKHHSNNVPNLSKPHIITTNIEHDSVTLYIRSLVEDGVVDASFVPVSKESGQICWDDLKHEIREETCLITIILASNETGIIQPLHVIGPLIGEENAKGRKYPILFHTDAAQAIGKLEAFPPDMCVDYLTMVGHKFYGPRIGALYAKNLHEDPKRVTPMFYGGGQERGYRAGTENVAMIAGLGKAADILCKHFFEYQANMIDGRNYLEKRLREVFKDKIEFNNIRRIEVPTSDSKVKILQVPRLPNTVSVAFKGLVGSSILAKAPELCASTGAACHSDKNVSQVLLNSGVSEDFAKGTLRLSVGRETTRLEIDKAIEYLQKAVNVLTVQTDTTEFNVQACVNAITVQTAINEFT